MWKNSKTVYHGTAEIAINRLLLRRSQGNRVPCALCTRKAVRALSDRGNTAFRRHLYFLLLSVMIMVKFTLL